MKRYFVAGGAGFIGSHLISRLLEDSDAEVTAFDNLSSGSREHLANVISNDRLTFVEGDLKDADSLPSLLEGIGHVFHLAANPDIAKAVTEPGIDFWQGTYLTHNLLEGCRRSGVKRLTYTSGSGVYGDLGEASVTESYGPLLPISTYGASKIACEAMISAYCHMFEMRALAFRFANIVGPRQTHGVCYDFIRRLLENSRQLTIQGDGRQSKSYIHIDDVLDAMLTFDQLAVNEFDVFNVATEEYVTVTEIADMVVDKLGISDVEYEYTGGTRGWKGDVPIVRFDTSKIRAQGWRNKLNSKQALGDAVDAMIAEGRRELDTESASRS